MAADMTMKKGFTLIEIMVSVAIFSVVMVISLGALLAISASDKKAETLKSVMNNLNFALDSMSRTIRTGVNYHCGSGGTLSEPLDCALSPGTSFTFLAADGNQVTYLFDSTPANCVQTGSTGGCIKRRIGNGDLLQLTAPEVVITNLSFYVVGAPVGDGIQPKVTISLNGSVQVTETQKTAFNLQTSVTQRLYDQ